MIVHFGNGPEAFKSRWEGRPKTPPFKWDHGLVGPTDQDWLQDGLDLYVFGVDDLISEDLAQVSPDAKDQDLKAVHALLVKYGGALQAIFKYYEAAGDMDVRDQDKMTLEQFRKFMIDAKVADETFKPDNIDECFSEVQLQNLKGAGKKQSNESSIGVEAFFIATLRVACRKFKVGTPNGFAELNMRLSEFLNSYIFTNIGPIFQKFHSEFSGFASPETQLLLRKGRRLTMQTLDSCQLRRVAAAERRLDVKYLAHHMMKWGTLKENKKGRPECIDFLDLARFVIFAKQLDGDLTQYTLHNSPYELNYDEFERFLAALAFDFYNKAGADAADREETFVEYLGEFLDDIFRKSGVLLEMKTED